MAVLLAVLSIPVAARWLSRVLRRLLTRVTDLEARDYTGLPHLSDHWTVGEIHIREGDWIADRALREMDLPGEGVLVLGIHRRTSHWTAPPGRTRACAPGTPPCCTNHAMFSTTSTTAAVAVPGKRPGPRPAPASAARSKSKRVVTHRNKHDRLRRVSPSRARVIRRIATTNASQEDSRPRPGRS
jgi:hypothetical protein